MKSTIAGKPAWLLVAAVEALAAQFYRAALASGRLDAYRRSCASIQSGSTLLTLGQLDEKSAF